MTDIDDSRPFPIQGDYQTGGGKSSTIPWWLAEIAYKQYAKQFGNQQTLERLAERGGFGREELVMLLAEREFFKNNPVCLCPADGHYAMCPIHKVNNSPR